MSNVEEIRLDALNLWYTILSPISHLQAPTNSLYGLHQELADHYVIISFSPVYADKLPLEHCLFGSICGMHCTM